MDEYLKISRQLRQKYEEIRLGRSKRYLDGEEKYKPIIQPMHELGTQLGSQIGMLKEMNNKIGSSESEDKVGDLALEYLLNPSGQLDKLYGLYRDDDGLYIGDKQISVFNNNIHLEGDETPYQGTRGLWELITMANPNPSLYTEEDLKNYSEIVLKTHTYKIGNKALARRFKKSECYKYTQIILPILHDNGIIKPAQKKKGEGLQKIFTNLPKEYVYYDSIDELLERLYILYGELKAGNTNSALKNEIINIILEFKEL